ncbi:MAG TPA: hypothetical protein VMZ91_01995 [Candidatus Paceibacterota bacterium]|nr:hypothetical protein [Candidatus Paceibacterota bacterium]
MISKVNLLKEKKCSICKKELPLSDFNIRQFKTKIGYTSACKKCRYLKYKKNNFDYKEKQKKYRQIEEVKQRNRECVKLYSYSEKGKETRRKYEKSTSVKFHKNFSRNIRNTLKDGKKRKHWEDLVGYSLNELIEHLENTSEYLIQDYFEKDLHIDHIIPKSLYNFKSHEDKEFKKCWNLRNLRLILAEENLKKGSKLSLSLIEQYNIEDLLPKENND